MRDITGSKFDVVDALNIVDRKKEDEKFSTLTKSWNTTGDTFDFLFKSRYRGVFFVLLKLENFPWDVQEIDITLKLRCPTWAAVMETFEPYPIVLQNRAGLQSSFSFGDVSAKVATSKQNASSALLQYSVFTGKVVLQRKPQYHIFNVMAPLTMITLCYSLIYTRSLGGAPLETSDRLSIGVTLLLTSVAYKLAVQSSIPVVSYATSLDLYFGGCFLFQFAVLAELATFPVVQNAINENYFVYGFLSTFLLSHIIFAMHVTKMLSVSEEDKLKAKNPLGAKVSATH